MIKHGEFDRKPIAHVIGYVYSKKYNKYRVELAIIGDKKLVAWMSEKQLDKLLSCFAHTENGYSTHKNTVYGYWNKRGYYAFSALENAYKPNLFIEPEQHDLSDLLEVD